MVRGGGAARMRERAGAAVLSRTLAARSGLSPDCFASLNVSPHTLLSEPVQTVFAAAGSLAATVVEVTEQSAVDDYQALAAFLRELRSRGAMTAVDDAGAGFASLSRVTRLRPDFVKIDRGLVADCDDDEAKLAALEMLGVLAGRIDAWVIAEGIERGEELEALLQLEVPLAQGYHFGRPADTPRDLVPAVRDRLVAAARARRWGAGVARLVERAPSVPMRETPGHVAAAL